MLWFVAVLVIILAAILYLVGKYNHIIGLGISCEEAISTVDVFLKKRFFLTFYWNPNETIITTANGRGGNAAVKSLVLLYI